MDVYFSVGKAVDAFADPGTEMDDDKITVTPLAEAIDPEGCYAAEMSTDRYRDDPVIWPYLRLDLDNGALAIAWIDDRSNTRTFHVHHGRHVLLPIPTARTGAELIEILEKAGVPAILEKIQATAESHWNGSNWIYTCDEEPWPFEEDSLSEYYGRPIGWEVYAILPFKAHLDEACEQMGEEAIEDALNAGPGGPLEAYLEDYVFDLDQQSMLNFIPDPEVTAEFAYLEYEERLEQLTDEGAKA